MLKFQNIKYGRSPVSTPNSWHRPLNLVSVKPPDSSPYSLKSLLCSRILSSPTSPSSNYTQSQKTALSIKHSTVTFPALSPTSLSVSVSAAFQTGLSEQRGSLCV